MRFSRSVLCPLPIAAGEELLIDYMAGDEREGLWFAVKDSQSD